MSSQAAKCKRFWSVQRIDNSLQHDGWRIEPSSNELMHYGIGGMKWGIRRFQNKDGTLTPAGKKRYGADVEEVKKKLDAARLKESEAKATYEKKQNRMIRLNPFEPEHSGRKYAKAMKQANKIDKILQRMPKDLPVGKIEEKGSDKSSVKISKDYKQNIKNFDKLSAEDKKVASEEIFKKIDELIESGHDGEADDRADEMSDKLYSMLPSNVFDVDAKDPISEENHHIYDVEFKILNRQAELKKQIGFKPTQYSSNDSQKVTEQKKQQEHDNWDRLMKAIYKDDKIQELCREQKRSSEALRNMVLSTLNLSDSERVKSWIDQLILGGRNYTYMDYLQPD